MDLFVQCGTAIDTQWRERNYAPACLPGIAVVALEVLPDFDYWDVIRWVNTTGCLPFQDGWHDKAGRWLITVYASDHFNIEIHFLLGSVADIHQPPFGGAFKVLDGRSICSTFDFTVKDVINDYCRLGHLHLRHMELLNVGDIRRVVAGAENIHSLLHVDQSSVTLVIRTASSDPPPQWTYRIPGLSYNAKTSFPLSMRRVETAALLMKVRPPGFEDTLRQVLAHSDFWTAAQILEKVWHSSRHCGVATLMRSTGEDLFSMLLEDAHSKFGRLTDYLTPIFIEESRQRHIRSRCQSLLEPGQRLFSALMLAAPDWRHILQFVGIAHPGQAPHHTVSDWIYDLLQPRADSHDIIGMEPTDDLLDVIDWLLEACLGARTEPPEVANLDEIIEQLRQNILFQSLPEEAVPERLAAAITTA